jgi:hypothetical protein
MGRCLRRDRVRHFSPNAHSVYMTTTRRLGWLAILTIMGAACSSKDAILRVRDGAVDQSTTGLGGASSGSGGAGDTAMGGGGGATGTGGNVTGTGGRNSGGIATGTGGAMPGSGGAGGILTGIGGIGAGGTALGTGGSGSGRGGDGHGGALSTGGNSGVMPGTGGMAGQGGSAQGGTAWQDAGSDASYEVAQPNCPSSVPSGSCSVSSSTICYYGDDPRWFCKTSAKCSQNTWRVTPALAECATTPDPSCPADPASPPVSICATDAGASTTCVYSAQYCKCGFVGGLDPGWVCTVAIPDNCPALRPGDGSPCAAPSGIMCTYGLACSGNELQCIEGRWVTMPLPC